MPFVSVKVLNIEKVNRELGRLRKKSRKNDNGVVTVGYTAKYAMFVHELIAMKLKGQKRRPPARGRYWDPQGKAKAKFLEEPLRRSVRGLVGIVRTRYKKTNSIMAGLLSAGIHLRDLSKRFAPKETGELRKSAFVQKDK